MNKEFLYYRKCDLYYLNLIWINFIVELFYNLYLYLLINNNVRHLYKVRISQIKCYHWTLIIDI